MSWLLFALLVFCLFLILAVPGLLLLFLLCSRPISTPLLLLSPVVGLGLLGILTIVSIPFHNWSILYPLVLTLVLGGLLVWSWRRRTAESLPTATRLATQTRSKDELIFAAAGVLVFAAVYLPALWLVWTDPSNPQSWGDAAFHTQGTALILESGNVSPFDALGAIYDPISKPQVYYPTLWHSLVALVAPLTGVATASNALSVLVGLVLWPMSLSGLALALSARSSSALWAPVFAVMAPIFPGVILFGNGMSPFSLSLPTIPAAVSLLVLWMKSETSNPLWKSPLLLLFGTVVIASATAQPATTLLLLLAAVSAIVVWVLDAATVLFKKGSVSAGLLIVAGTLVVISLSIMTLLRLPLVENLGKFERAGMGLKATIVTFLTGIGTTQSYLPWALILILGILGGLLVIKSPPGKTALLAFLGYFILFVAAAGPDTPLRALTGFWYKDYTRLGAIALAGVAIFAAVGTAWLLDMAARRAMLNRSGVAIASAVGTVVFLGIGKIGVGGTSVGVYPYVARGYYLGTNVSNMLDLEQVELLSQVDDFFPGGSYLVGPPSTGVEFVAQVSHARNFITLNPPKTSAQQLLANEIDQINNNPQICEVIQEAGIEGVVTRTTDDKPADDAYLAFFNLDTVEGFNLLSQVGDFSLWEITACE